MKQTSAIFLILFLFGALFLSVTVAQTTFAKSAKDSKARRDIDKAIGRATEGKFSEVQTVNITTKTAPNATLTVYNISSRASLPPIIQPPPGPQICNKNDHFNTTTGVCVPDSPTSGYNICMLGDFKDSKLFDAMKTNGCDYRVALGDMGYSNSLELVKSIGPDKAVCGNHDSAEDESAAIEKECLAYAGDSWWVKFGAQTLMFGFNTNSDLTKQLNAAKNLLADANFMSGVKNVITVSHKNGHVPPNSHHPAEAKDFFAKLNASISDSIKIFEVSSHNHQSSAADSKNWYIAGAGGRSFYQCGVNQDWNFCDNKKIAYLQFNLDNEATITPHFIDTTGKIIH